MKSNEILGNPDAMLGLPRLGHGGEGPGGDLARATSQQPSPAGPRDPGGALAGGPHEVKVSAHKTPDFWESSKIPY